MPIGGADHFGGWMLADAKTGADRQTPARLAQASAAPAGRPAARSARAILRSATDSVHQRMHRHPGFAALADGTIERAAYRALLARIHGFYRSVEARLALGNARSTALADDLVDLGLSRGTLEALPSCAPLQIGESPAETIGARYVVFGASLGGQVMAKALARRAPALPTRFLCGTGSADWSRFVASLDAHLPDGAARALAARAAVTTFAALEGWMDGWRPHDD
ncbi:biliverdin-producing heme oxygenase [Sphingomonas sp. RB3P16]|uniref:biliverdin-producing heme oxygenase n=1 Tax=Parasphingomonas frigoris TaxID=3096163 RepID=UPI002FC68C62